MLSQHSFYMLLAHHHALNAWHAAPAAHVEPSQRGCVVNTQPAADGAQVGDSQVNLQLGGWVGWRAGGQAAGQAGR